MAKSTLDMKPLMHRITRKEFERRNAAALKSFPPNERKEIAARAELANAHVKYREAYEKWKALEAARLEDYRRLDALHHQLDEAYLKEREAMRRRRIEARREQEEASPEGKSEAYRQLIGTFLGGWGKPLRKGDVYHPF
jgi:hypothetical protein